jgi:hypothetical protein
MNKGVRILVSIVLLLTICGLFIRRTRHWFAYGQAQESRNSRVSLPAPYAQVDEKAAVLKGADEKPIRELADAVVVWVVGDNLPSVLVSPFKEQLIQAQINYRSGRKAGIPAGNIVRVIDELAETLNAPEYARTDEDEVRDTRLAISYMMPHFIVHQPLAAGEESTGGLPYTLNPTMSPLEAVYVTRFLIMQKEINESSQITREERAEVKLNVKKLRAEGFQLNSREQGSVISFLIDQKLHPDKPQLTPEELATRAQQQSTELAKKKTQVVGVYLSALPNSGRSEEMRAVFHRAYTMKVGDALALTNKALELLGIEY